MSENRNNNTEANGLTENRYNVIIKMLQAIAKREGIEDPKIELSKGSEKGDGFIGEKHRALLQGDKKSMDLFVKGSPTNKAFQKAFDPRPIYLSEIMFYNDLYPAFNQFQTEKNIPLPFNSVIECVDTCDEQDNEILILQNAKGLGYELCDKMKQLNHEHIEFVYTEYGKYHGISFALKDQKPEVYQDLVDKLPTNAIAMIAEKLHEWILKMVEKGKDFFDPEKDAHKYNRYAEYTDTLREFVLNVANVKDPYTVFVHGDCWSNNMMFKYAANSDKSIPDKVCLVDFQLIGQGSPVLDLSYVLYACSPKEIYANLDHYLHIYHNSLSKTIRDLGSDPEVLMPFGELKNQWKLYSRYGLMMATSILKICVQEGDEIWDLAELMEASDDTDPVTIFMTAGKHEALYHQRFRDLIEHMIENEFI